jgi:CspA family cold shock protein
MAVGTVKWFNSDKGYGIIAQDSGQTVFVHYSAIQMDGFRALAVGDRVEFEVRADREGRSQAADVRKVDIAAGSGGSARDSWAGGGWAGAGDRFDIGDWPEAGGVRDSTGPADPPQPIVEAGIPVSIYLGSADGAEETLAAMRQVLDALGIAVIAEQPPVIGSWRKNLLGWFRRSEEAADLLKRTERALELLTLHKPQSEVDANQADALSKLVKSLENQTEAFIRIGSLYLLKMNGVVVAGSLTQRQLAFLERRKAFVASPADFVAALDEFEQQGPESASPLGEIAPWQGVRRA